MESAMEELRQVRKDVLVKDARTAHGGGSNDDDYEDIKRKWIRKVKKVKDDVGKVSSRYHLRRFRISSDFSLSFWTIYGASQNAIEIREEIMKLKGEGIRFVSSAAPQSRIHKVPDSVNVVGMRSYEERLEDYIKDENIRVVGIWGMGGVGKSTLLKAIRNNIRRLCENENGMKLFDHVISARTTEELKEDEIRKELAKDLNLNLPGNANPEAINAKIHEFLQDKSFLLLLDNLWQKLDLEKIGVPDVESKEKRRMVIFTTRSKAVCAEMRAATKLKIECLDPDHAWNLFQDKLSKDVISNPAIRIIAREVADECCGLPLALVVVGGAMFDKNDLRDWRIALTALQQSIPKNIPDTEKFMFPVLKLSYNNLENTLKQCFLSCTLWPRCYGIKKEELINCWIGLGLIPQFSKINDAYNQGETLVWNLLSVCLLQNSSSEEEKVVMHDLIHSLAMWIVSCDEEQQWMTRSRSTDLWRTTERVSLMGQEIEELPREFDFCNNLTVMMLNMTSIEVIPSKFFLHILHITYLDLSETRIQNLPSAIGRLKMLEYLNLSRTSIKSLPSALSGLENLKYLLLRHTGIGVLPHSLVSSMKSLFILDVFPLASIDPKSPKTLQHTLKALGTSTSKVQSLNTLRSLPTAWLRVQHLEDMKSLELQQLGENKGECINELEIVDCEDLEEIVMEGGSKMKDLKRIMHREVKSSPSVKNLRRLRVESCPKLKNITWVLQLQWLEEITIVSCAGMEQMLGKKEDGFSNSKATSTDNLTSLRKLSLQSLHQLSSICNHAAVAFPSLISVSITDCKKLKRLPSEMINENKSVEIWAKRSWWEDLEWNDDTIKASFQHHFRELP